MTNATNTPKAPTVDLKLEIVVIPVSDVERAKQFYAKLGWRHDADPKQCPSHVGHSLTS